MSCPISDSSNGESCFIDPVKQNKTKNLKSNKNITKINPKKKKKRERNKLAGHCGDFGMRSEVGVFGEVYEDDSLCH